MVFATRPLLSPGMAARKKTMIGENVFQYLLLNEKVHKRR